MKSSKNRKSWWVKKRTFEGLTRANRAALAKTNVLLSLALDLRAHDASAFIIAWIERNRNTTQQEDERRTNKAELGPIDGAIREEDSSLPDTFDLLFNAYNVRIELEQKKHFKIYIQSGYHL